MSDFTDPENTRSRRLASRPAEAQGESPFADDGQPAPCGEEGRKKRRARTSQTADTEPARTQEQEKAPRRRSFRLEEYAGQVLSGNILTRAEVRRQYPYIFFMAVLMLLYIANGYHIQKLHRQHDKLTEQIKELRSRSLTISSIRMTATRQSEIIKELDARGIPLRESLSPPKVIEK